MKKHEMDEVHAEEAMTQYGSICFRVRKKDGCKVLLITSRDTGRWVIPKGWPMKGKSGPEAALQEAYEEAGVEGRVRAESSGLYSYDKILDDGTPQPCVVTVYPVKVVHLHGKYPERDQRRRRWFSPKKAAKKVNEPELQEILASFDPDLQAGGKSGAA